MSESLQDPSWQHPLGTDLQGRDELTRLIYGTRTALEVGIVTVGSAAIIGTVLGLIAGYLGGAIEMVIMRKMDALMGFPLLVLALLIAAVLGGVIQNVIIALSVATLPGYTRLMCGMTLTVKENDYILAEKVLGASSLRTMLPVINLLPTSLWPMWA